jgi:hypothetical protein
MDEVTLDMLKTVAGLAFAIAIIVTVLRSFVQLPALYERLVALSCAIVIALIVTLHETDQKYPDATSLLIVLLNAFLAYLAAYGLRAEIGTIKALRSLFARFRQQNRA